MLSIGCSTERRSSLPRNPKRATFASKSTRIRAGCPFGTVRVRSALMCGSELDSAKLVGGSEADRQRVLERMHEYLGINARFDWRYLPGPCRPDPAAVSS